MPVLFSLCKVILVLIVHSVLPTLFLQGAARANCSIERKVSWELSMVTRQTGAGISLKRRWDVKQQVQARISARGSNQGWTQSVYIIFWMWTHRF